VLIHEAIHHAIQPALIDVYKGTKLFGLFGGKGLRSRQFTAAALKNPDSYVTLVRTMTSDLKEKSVAELSEDKFEDKIEGEVDVEPIIGRKRILIAVRLAQRSLDETRYAINVVLASPPLQAWRYYPDLQQDVVELLRNVGRVAGLQSPVPEPGVSPSPQEILERIARSLEAFISDLKDKTLTIRRETSKRTTNKDGVVVSIPKHVVFGKMSRPDQVRLILDGAGIGKHVLPEMSDVVVGLSMKYGILQGFKK
jgi:hypothetical protein